LVDVVLQTFLEMVNDDNNPNSKREIIEVFLDELYQTLSRKTK
jgi:hypothetical protein